MLVRTMQHTKPKDNDEFLETSNVARECEVSGQTVLQWERAGKLKAIRTANGKRLYRREDVEELKRKRQVTA
jgi:DNA-binding transcriptional MerR regulator